MNSSSYFKNLWKSLPIVKYEANIMMCLNICTSWSGRSKRHLTCLRGLLQMFTRGLLHFVKVLLYMSKPMLGEYEEKCENWTRFQADSQFESFMVSHWVMFFMKPGCKVSYNVKTGPLKLGSNMYFNFIKSLARFLKN
jgi:hypothetical protein